MECNAKTTDQKWNLTAFFDVNHDITNSWIPAKCILYKKLTPRGNRNKDHNIMKNSKETQQNIERTFCLHLVLRNYKTKKPPFSIPDWIKNQNYTNEFATSKRRSGMFFDENKLITLLNFIIYKPRYKSYFFLWTFTFNHTSSCY